MNNENQQGILLTGGTGLIGSYLLNILLEKKYRLFVLVRSNNKKNAENRVLDNLNFWNPVSMNYKNNLILIEGDITQRNLGIDEKSLSILNDEISEIYHCAALTKFNVPLEVLRKVNVEGLTNILELASKWHKKGKLKKINHLSTAYVCGDYNGRFEENDLDVGQKFYTPYEQSKFEAEKLVNNFRQSGLWIDVFRPPVVIGETLTGKTLSFNQAFYQTIHFLSLGLLEYLPCRNMNFNLVYLDELCKSIFCISLNTRIKNKNYHVFSSEIFSAEQVLDLFYKYVNVEKPVFINPEKFFQDKATPTMKMLLKHNFCFLNRKARLDSVYTNKLLNENGFVYSKPEENKFSKILDYAMKKGFINRGSE